MGKGPLAPLSTTRSSALVAADEAAQVRLRVSVILATLIVTPEALHAHESEIERLDCADPDHATLRSLILRHAHHGAATLRQQILDELGPAPLENLLSLGHVAITPAVRRPGDRDIATMTLAEELAKLHARNGLLAEIDEATHDLDHIADEALTWRLGQAAEASQRALRSEQQERTEYETGANGARISRDERDAFEALLQRIGHGNAKK